MSDPSENETARQIAGNAGVPGSREQRLADALAEFVDLQAQEETADPASFCRKYPELEPDLRHALEALREIDQMTLPGGPPLPEVPAGLPERLSGHKILGEVGSGGMGRVLLATDERLGRKVAIKTLKPHYRDNVTLRSRFMQEARALAKLNHPNIVRIYNLGQPEEEPHFVMEYVEGAPLPEAARGLTLDQKVELMHKIVLAVDFLHQHQLLHRDLKPGNILVVPGLEPKLLDFGLARQVDDWKRLTTAGDILGTPRYFSPEQTRGDTHLDERSDVFSLGTILYELLTGSLPFRGEKLDDQLQNVRERDPVLPRRLNPSISRDLQNVILKALEKNPADRYASAREMAEDLERFLAREPVMAAPSSYLRMIAGKMDQHLRELEGWKQDQILSDYEYDALRKAYERLSEREDTWIMEFRRLSLSQVCLYLGAWVLVIGAGLIFLFHYVGLSGLRAVLVVTAAAVPTLYYGIRNWRAGRLRFAVAYLLAFCLLLPLLLLVTMGQYGLLKAFSRNREDLELFTKFPSFKQATNAQMWWALLLSLPAYLWLRRFTRASVFSLVFAVMGALLSLVTLLRMGMLEWFESDPGKVYLRLIPIALIFFLAAMALERLRHPSDSRYFYPIAVVFTFIALSGVAGFHEPYARWLKNSFGWTRGQVEYLFIINAGIYLTLQTIAERINTPQMRTVAKSFRFVIPGHVLTSLLLLGVAATKLWEDSPESLAMRREARTFEILLPLAACLFVLGSIPKQMKNFLATGLLFLAIGIIRLQQDLFKDRAFWPILLLLLGVLLMVGAAKYSGYRLSILRWFRRKP